MPSPRTIATLVMVTLAAAAAGRPARAQLHPIEQGNKGPVISYEISFPNIVHHEAEVTALFTSVPAGPLHARMARSSTGRYALHEFAKNVYSLKAADAKGRALVVTRPDPYGWDIAGHDGTVKVTYTLFADRADGTYPGFDAVQAHIQPQGTFLYARGLEQRPVRVTIHRPDPAWTIATQLVPTSDPETFTGPGMQYLFDSPTHVGRIQWREWTETSGGHTLTFRAAVDDPAPAATIDEYAEGAKKIAREAAAVYGEFPAFDFGTYTFVACYRPSCNGDGMEHRNSTSVTGGASMGTSALRELGTVAHEFFHAWNVKRIRPATLEPFDYDRANISGELWIAEGFTQYYGPLLEARAGVTQSSAFVRSLGGTVNTMTNAPGRRYFGPIGMSQQAPFTDAAVSIDPQNRANTFISYYTYGAGIALAIDLSLRSRGDRTLDDFMRVMWKNHGKPEIPYSLDDARRALATASGDSAWAWDLWKRYIAGHELPDYPTLLANAGILVRKAQAGAAWIGDYQIRPAQPNQPGAPLTIGSSVLAGSPLYDAGLDRGDRIIALDGKDMGSEAEFRAAVAAHKPGDKVNIAFEGRAGRREALMTVAENPAVQVVTFEDAGLTPSEQQLTFRARWLSTRQQ
ncbi:MAG TPA: PDZ domain-containing protein [Gemmatimonadaceae bacterium]